jgi:preprotein translocase subunit SecD
VRATGNGRSAGSAVVAVAALALAAGILGCAQAPSPAPTAGETPVARTYTICPPGTDPPPQAATNLAESVLRKRLATLGVEPTAVTVGRCIDISVPAGTLALDAALLSSGVVRFAHVPEVDIGTVVAGRPIPNGLQVMLRQDGIESARIEPGPDGEPTLQVRFTEQGAAAMRAWTTDHVGDLIAIVVDGVAVAVPTVSEPFGRDVSVVLGRDGGYPIEALAAILAAGPLPPEWEQPESPQG